MAAVTAELASDPLPDVGDVSYSSLRRFLARTGLVSHAKRRMVRMAPSAPGEIAEMDFGRLGTLVHAETGARQVVWALTVILPLGELLGLRWRDIDLTVRSIALQQQLQWLAGHGYVMRAVKTHRSRRPISIDLDLVDVLRSYKVRQNEDRLQAGDLWMGNDLVFTNELGEHLTRARCAALCCAPLRLRACLASGCTI
jgi:integrase